MCLWWGKEDEEEAKQRFRKAEVVTRYESIKQNLMKISTGEQGQACKGGTDSGPANKQKATRASDGLGPGHSLDVEEGKEAATRLSSEVKRGAFLKSGIVPK